MRAYKFFHPGAVAPFAGFAWPQPAVPGEPGPWVEAGGARVCVQGVHACLLADMPYWAAEDLWEVELDGEIIRRPRKVVAFRGRLLARVDAWSDGGRTRFDTGCAWHARDVAAAQARNAGATAAADELLALDSLADLRRQAARVAGELSGIESVIVGYASDAAHYVLVGEPAVTALITAIQAADAEAGEIVHDLDAPGFIAERQRQAQWLADHFGFTDDPLPAGGLPS